jgi:hypothetical protein
VLPCLKGFFYIHVYSYVNSFVSMKLGVYLVSPKVHYKGD